MTADVLHFNPIACTNGGRLRFKSGAVDHGVEYIDLAHAPAGVRHRSSEGIRTGALLDRRSYLGSAGVWAFLQIERRSSSYHRCRLRSPAIADMQASRIHFEADLIVDDPLDRLQGSGSEHDITGGGHVGFQAAIPGGPIAAREGDIFFGTTDRPLHPEVIDVRGLVAVVGHSDRFGKTSPRINDMLEEVRFNVVRHRRVLGRRGERNGGRPSGSEQRSKYVGCTGVSRQCPEVEGTRTCGHEAP